MRQVGRNRMASLIFNRWITMRCTRSRTCACFFCLRIYRSGSVIADVIPLNNQMSKRIDLSPTTTSRRVAAVLSCLVAVALLGTGLMLLIQSVQAASPPVGPLGAADSHHAANRSSMILGVSSVILSAVCVTARVLSIRRKLKFACGILGIAILLFFGIAAVVNPFS